MNNAMLPSAPQADQEGVQSALIASKNSFMTLLANITGDPIVIEIGPNLKDAIGYVAMFLALAVFAYMALKDK